VRELTPPLVRRVLIPGSYLVFFAGLVSWAAIYYAGKPFDATDAIISGLQSPDENPHGYGVSAAGTSVQEFCWCLR
jgi:hypothetical protein